MFHTHLYEKRGAYRIERHDSILLIKLCDTLLEITAADTAEEPSFFFLFGKRAAILEGDDPGVWCVPSVGTRSPVGSGSVVSEAGHDLSALRPVQVDDGT